tara:strand:- start:5845 stop:6561 length:717 start_codon:yes stop_codon:yes gene_type:complete
MANLHSRRIRGNLAYYDTHRKRLIDAVGPDVIKYDLQPGHLVGLAGAAPPGWTETVVEVGAGTSDFTGTATAGFIGNVVTAANENDGWSGQLSGSSFELTSDQDTYFGCEFQINDVTQVDFFMGLAVTDTAILGGVDDRMGFQSLDASTDLKFMLEKSTTETLTASLATLADATNVFVEFYWDGSGVEVFVDGSSVATPAVTNIPDDVALRLSLEVLTGEAVAQTMKIRQMRIIQIGR